MKTASALCSLALAACATGAPPGEPTSLVWQLATGDPVTRILMPLEDVQPDSPPERRLVVTLDSVSLEPAAPFYQLMVEVHCPDGEDLLKSTSITDFPPGAGGRFVLYLPPPEAHCHQMREEAPIQITLTLGFIDGPQPLQLKGRLHIQ